MPIFSLGDDIRFPPVELADRSGVLAVGGDLSSERLINAYSRGIFPWYTEEQPIVWWSPDPRFVLFPDEIRISKSMRQVLRRNVFKITGDVSFREVINQCSMPRPNQEGTWISSEMIDAYTELHNLGYAHSVEAWHNGDLAGGLYGVSLGRCFFGESMFTRVSNASKAAFIALACKLRERGFLVIDCQVYTEHLESLGARFIHRADFLELLNQALRCKTQRGQWTDFFQ